MDSICAHYGKCGGCSLQHIPYEVQIKNKAEEIKRITGLNKINIFYDKPFHYRNRMDLIFHSKGLGFRRKGHWNRIVDIRECLIANNQINKLLKEIRDFFKEPDYFHLQKQKGTFKYALIRATRYATAISFVINEDSSRIRSAIEKVEEFSKITTADNIIITYVPKKRDVSYSTDFFVVKGSDHLYEVILGKKFYFSLQGFFQNNPVVAEMMNGHINKLLKSYNTKDSYLIDLYGGVGVLGIINSEFFNKTFIIENFEQSSKFAEINIKENSSKALFFNLDAKNINKIKGLYEVKDPFLILDPPRSGLTPKVIKRIKELKPKVIVYISCNPKQFEREIKYFPEYKIKSAAMFDMFPQTPHIELVIELIRA